MFKSLVWVMMGVLAWNLCANETEPSRDKIRNSPGFWKLYTDALRGEKVAQFQVGVMFERGLGVDKNETAAASWYEKSAIQGYSDAQYNLGIMYASGRGLELNQGFALMWLGLAAKQGDKEAKQLVMDMIAGKLDPVSKTSTASQITGEIKPIKAVRFSAKEGASICDASGECRTIAAHTTLTSKSKRGSYYKVSGIGTAKGWEPYPNEGWIEEKSVEIRR